VTAPKPTNQRRLLVAFGSISFAHTARRLRATGPQKTSALSSCQDMVSLLGRLLRSIKWLPLLEISQNRETGECREEMFERMSTEDKVRID
jgi:hypothetical protein